MRALGVGRTRKDSMAYSRGQLTDVTVYGGVWAKTGPKGSKLTYAPAPKLASTMPKNTRQTMSSPMLWTAP